MKTYIALFRGINVGGKGSLPMRELVTLLEKLGCRNVRTYIQSGNAVFESDEKNTANLAERISAEIEKSRGFKPVVMLLKPKDLEKAMEQNPFPVAEDAMTALHLGFLTSPPSAPDLALLENVKAGSEKFRLIGKVFYSYAPEGVGRSKLAANSERCLGVPMTDRNWRTVCKIMELGKA